MSFDLPPSFRDRYRNPRLQGAGGMGVAYRVYDETLQQEVLLKLISSLEGEQEELAERFRREVSALAQLEHPNVVTVFDFFEEQGELCFSMEHVEGQGFADFINSKGKSVEEVLGLVIQVAAGVAAINDAGVVHRNLSPAAVVVRNDGTAAISDFGFARRLDGAGPQLTADGAVVDTFSYMAPEALRGEAVDERSDVYQLGVLLYEALTRTLPYGAAALEQMTVGRAPAPPLPPSSLRKGVDGSLDELVLQALAHDPAERPPSAAAFRQQCRDWLVREHDTPPLPPPILPVGDERGPVPPQGNAAEGSAVDGLISTWRLSRRWKQLLCFITVVTLLVLGWAGLSRFEGLTSFLPSPVVEEVELLGIDTVRITFAGAKRGQAVLCLSPNGRVPFSFADGRPVAADRHALDVSLPRLIVDTTEVVVLTRGGGPSRSFRLVPTAFFDEYCSHVGKEADAVLAEVLLRIGRASWSDEPFLLRFRHGDARRAGSGDCPDVNDFIARRARQLQHALPQLMAGETLGTSRVRSLRSLRVLTGLGGAGLLSRWPAVDVDRMLGITGISIIHQQRPVAALLLEENYARQLRRDGHRRAELAAYTTSQLLGVSAGEQIDEYRTTVVVGNRADLPWPLRRARLVVETKDFDSRLALHVSINEQHSLVIVPRRACQRIEAPIALTMLRQGANTLHARLVAHSPDIGAPCAIVLYALTIVGE